MLALSRDNRIFLNDYSGQIATAQSAADMARDTISGIVRQSGRVVHTVSARAKGLTSLRGKLRRKRYSHPAKQVTDLIGVRVITYYRDDVDPIVAELRKNLEIDDKRSADKRTTLDLHSFGYRSVHLIGRLKSGTALNAQHRFLMERWFEIQVRSILEHTWAEIEHEIVYKSGVVQPDSVSRRFAALAGALELLDGEFLALRGEQEALIEEYASSYKKKKDQRKSFDVARLLGFLRAWSGDGGAAFPAGTGLEPTCVEALRAVGLGTPTSLALALRSRSFKRSRNSFASLHGIAPESISHLAQVVLAVAMKDARVIKVHFPEMMYDPILTQIVERRAQKA